MPRSNNTTVTRYQFVYSVLGLITGTITILRLVLFLNGVTGKVNLTAKALGASSQLTDTAPGVVFVLAGICIVFVTRFDGRSRRREQVKSE